MLRLLTKVISAVLFCCGFVGLFAEASNMVCQACITITSLAVMYVFGSLFCRLCDSEYKDEQV